MKDDDVVRKIKLQKFYFYHFIFLIPFFMVQLFQVQSSYNACSFFLTKKSVDRRCKKPHII